MAAKKKAVPAAQPKKLTVKAAKQAVTEAVKAIDPVTVEAAPAVVKTKKKGASEAEVTALFVDLRGKLTSTEDAKKQSRQLRWALKSLELAQQAAVRHFTHL